MKLTVVRLARITMLCTTCLAAKYNVASLRNFTRIIGQSYVIEDGSFFQIIERFNELSLRLLQFSVPAKFSQYNAQFRFR